MSIANLISYVANPNLLTLPLASSEADGVYLVPFR